MWTWNYFTFSEVFRAKKVDTSFVTPDILRNISRVLDAITEVRKEVNEPIIVHSFYRDPFHNAEARKNGKEQDATGYHPKGLAIDIRHLKNYSVDQTLTIVKRYFNGIIIYDWGFHLDLRDGFYFHDNRLEK